MRNKTKMLVAAVIVTMAASASMAGQPVQVLLTITYRPTLTEEAAVMYNASLDCMKVVTSESEIVGNTYLRVTLVDDTVYVMGYYDGEKELILTKSEDEKRDRFQLLGAVMTAMNEVFKKARENDE